MAVERSCRAQVLWHLLRRCQIVCLWTVVEEGGDGSCWLRFVCVGIVIAGPIARLQLCK